MKKTLLFNLVFMCGAFIACSEKETPTKQPVVCPVDTFLYEVASLPASTELALTERNNDFSCRLFREILKHQEKPNVFISPLSASLALSMTTNGAAGLTEKEMLATLGFSDYTVDDLNAYYKKLVKQLLEADASVDLGIANSIWMNEVEAPVINPLFLDINKKCYDAEVHSLSFNAAAIEMINGWCKEKTKGRISTILNEIDKNAVMYLINALYFKGAWKTTFDKKETFDWYFMKPDGSYLETPMMRKMDTVRWASDETVTAIELPYGNEAFNMTVLMPQKGKTIDDAVAVLTPENWKKWDEMFMAASSYQPPYRGLQETLIIMPKFKIKWEMKLNEVLKAMGMPTAFTQAADFSKISSGLNISFVKQHTFVEVNEEGTEAAAVTIVELEKGSVDPSPEMILDRPFLFAIREKASGAILFLGKIDEPMME